MDFHLSGLQLSGILGYPDRILLGSYEIHILLSTSRACGTGQLATILTRTTQTELVESRSFHSLNIYTVLK